MYFANLTINYSCQSIKSTDIVGIDLPRNASNYGYFISPCSGEYNDYNPELFFLWKKVQIVYLKRGWAWKD
jgi:hypothetical protein